ncbi:MAG: hypothetical protein M9921_08940 [Fimbriimonadaceae bacterium]|nr:hypothetical protein [Fimbriimonadaceae bacterium]
MLFAMAVECWLKCLILAATPVDERVARSKQKGFRTHNLASLARESGVDGHLSDHARDYLDLLTSLIVGMGRFPGPDKPHHLIPWWDQSVDEGSWKEIQEGIARRRDSLIEFL